VNSENRTDPIRLALVITELEVGGAERCLTHLAVGVDRSKFSPEVYSLGPCPQGEQRELVDRLEQAGVPVHFLNARSARHALGAVMRLRKLLQAQRAEVVQTFLFHANVIGAMGVWGTNRALVAGLRVADPSRWRQRWERRCLRRASQIVCVSESVAEFARTAKFNSNKLTVIPNGIDVDGAPQAFCGADLSEWGIPKDRRGVLFVGRMHPQKGVDLLLNAAPDLLASADVDLLLVGDGPERPQYEAQAAILPQANRIHFLGWRSDVAQIMAASELFVLPSRWEGMPNALIEAMAAGLPVVVSDAEGSAEVLGPNKSSQTFYIKELATFSKLSNVWLNNREQSIKQGQSNRARIAAEFSLQRMIRQYESMWAVLAPAES